MLKKFILTSSLFLLSQVAFSMEFLGKELETLNRNELTTLLKDNGAKPVKKENLTDTYSLTKSKIPYAKYGIAYYNYQNEFVGLKIIFDYDEHNLVNLRKNLVAKYGKDYTFIDFFGAKPNNNELSKDLFFEKASWKYKSTSIEYNAKTFDQDRGELSGYAFLFFREDSRKEKLINELKEKSLKNDDSKFKGVF